MVWWCLSQVEHLQVLRPVPVERKKQLLNFSRCLRGGPCVGQSFETFGSNEFFDQQSNAEVAVREMLKEFGRRTLDTTGESVLRAEDFMDDGSRISLTVSIDVDAGEAVFDFSGSGPEVYGNINAPKAVVLSALIYSLRCLIGQDIPLNQVRTTLPLF